MKQNLHLLKVGISQHSYYICQFPAIFRLMWAFAFFSILYPEKNIRLPHGYPTTSWEWAILDLPLWVVTYIHAKELMYDLSNNTVALRNFLPTAYGSRCFF